MTVSASVTDYPLPVDFRKIYTVRLSQQPLFYCSQRDYDKFTWDPTQQVGTTHYSTFKIGQENKISLIPQHDKADTLTVKYYSAITLPTEDEAELGIQENWVQPILDYAKSIVAASRSMDGRRNFFMQQAITGFRAARGDDVTEPDEVQGLKVEPTAGYPPGSSWYYIRQHYGF